MLKPFGSFPTAIDWALGPVDCRAGKRHKVPQGLTLIPVVSLKIASDRLSGAGRDELVVSTVQLCLLKELEPAHCFDGIGHLTANGIKTVR